MAAKIPEIGCSYIPPDQCTDFTPAPCCERIGDDKDDTDAGVVMMASTVLLLVFSAAATLL